jgi:hypothetical protein
MGMRKRFLVSFALLMGLGLLGLVCVARWTAPPKDSIDPETIRQIQPGMTEAEVQALLGIAAGFHSRGRAVPDTAHWILPPGATTKQWLGERAGVYVCFGPDGRVVFTVPVRMHPVELSLFNRFRSWARF